MVYKLCAEEYTFMNGIIVYCLYTKYENDIISLY
nr:MAG TPA_asm: hypothetical protein [Caudoviricetes sp.]